MARSNKTGTIMWRICPWCQTEFPVCRGRFPSGTGIKPYRQTHCSKSCSNQRRTKRPVAKQLSPTDAAYLAGIIDGEGSIVRLRRYEPGSLRGVSRHTWRLVVVNTDQDLIEWCRAATGCGSIADKPRIRERHKPCWTWQCYAWNALVVLKQVRPYMKIKAAKATTAIADLEVLVKRSVPFS